MSWMYLKQGQIAPNGCKLWYDQPGDLGIPYFQQDPNTDGTTWKNYVMLLCFNL